MSEVTPAFPWVDVVCDQCELYYSRQSEILGVTVMVFDKHGRRRDVGQPAPMRIGPCPRCGSNQGLVVSGIRESVKGAAHTILSSNPDVIAQFRTMVEEFLARPDLTAREAADILDQRSSAFAGISTWLRENEHLAAWLGVLLSLLAIWQTQQSSDEAPHLNPSEIQTIVTEVVKDVLAASPHPTAPPAAARPSRNAPCPCGSGNKYKRCHGRQATPTPGR